MRPAASGMTRKAPQTLCKADEILGAGMRRKGFYTDFTKSCPIVFAWVVL